MMQRDHRHGGIERRGRRVEVGERDGEHLDVLASGSMATTS